MVKDIYHISYTTRCFFNFGSEIDAGHSNNLEVVFDEGLGVEEAVEQHLPRRHRHLRQAEEDPGRLDELAAQDAQVGLAVQVQAVLHGGGGREPLLGDERVVDGERHLRVQPVPNEDARGRWGRRRGGGSGSRRSVGRSRGHDR